MSETPPPSFQPRGGSNRNRPVRKPATARQSILPDRSNVAPTPTTQPPATPTPPPTYAPRRKVPPPAAPAYVQDGTQRAPSTQQQIIPRKRASRGRLVALGVAAALIAWPAFLLFWVNGNLNRVDALVPGPASSGTTYLLTGSDGRDPDSGSHIQGERADSIMLIRRAPGGQATMVSLPRDLYVNIPEYGWNKINASYSFGGPQLLVSTVQELTGLKVDHYMQINMQGFGPLVDAVGGVELCLDLEVDDKKSGLQWEPGCHHADGETALAFSRMRYQDPRGDLGRAERQRDVVKAVTKKSLSPGNLINPLAQWKLANAGSQTLTVDEKTGPFAIAKLLLTFQAASKSGLSGTPPLASIAEPTDVGSVVVLDEQTAPEFFRKLEDGTLTEADFDSSF